MSFNCLCIFLQYKLRTNDTGKEKARIISYLINYSLTSSSDIIVCSTSYGSVVPTSGDEEPNIVILTAMMGFLF